MNIKSTRKYNYILIVAAIILMCFENHFASQAIEKQADKLLRIEYYRLLELVQDSPPPQKIILLSEFLESRDTFDEIYLHLFDQYLLSNMLGDAENYFKTQLSRGEAQDHIFWILGKIYAVQHRGHMAEDAFSRSLRSHSPSLGLIEEAVNFYHLNGNSDKLRGLNLGQFHSRFMQGLLIMKKSSYQKALSIFKELHAMEPENGRVQFYCGLCNLKLNHFEQARYFWQNSLNESRLQGNLHEEAFLLVNMGILHFMQGNYARAGHHYDMAEKIIHRISDFRLKEFLTGNRAWLDLIQNKHQLAISRFEKAAQLALSLHEYDHAAEWYLGKGRALFESDSLNLVLPNFELSDYYAKLANNSELRIRLNLERGKFYVHLNLNDFARREFSEAVESSKQLPWPNLHQTALVHQAELFIHNKHYSAARTIYRNMLMDSNADNSQHDSARLHWLMGETCLGEDSLKAASRHYRNAFRVAFENQNYTQCAMASLRLGDVLMHAAQHDSAIRYYNEALLTELADQNWELEVELNMGMGKAYHCKNDIDRALMFYNRAANVIEKNREKLLAAQFRLGYFSKGAWVYDALIHAYSQRFQRTGNESDLEKIYYCLEMSQARVLRDSKMNTENQRASMQEYSKYQGAVTELERLQRQVRFHPQDMDSLKIELEAARYNLINRRLMLLKDTQKTNTKNQLSLQALRKGLEETKFGLLFYHIADAGSFVLSIQNSVINIIPLKTDEARLTAMIDSLISPFSNVTFETIDKTDFFADIAHRLYTVLIEPVEEKVALKKHLIIIPNAPLNILPFELLLTARSQKSTYLPDDEKDYAGNFLLHRYAFIYSPSSWLVNSAEHSDHSDAGILILANPVSLTNELISGATAFSLHPKWNPEVLLFADEEAQNIKRQQKNVKIFHRNTAIPESLFAHAANFPIIHFATHAFIDTSFDAFSGLVLAPSNRPTDDGLLMGYEIADMHLNCDLVTLSACETAQGKMMAGEGILGLPRLFLSSGANNVLMTHWKVDDKFTSKLMPKFYEFMLTKHLPKTEALKQAQLSFINANAVGNHLKYQHPVYWASFALYGMPDINVDYFAKNGKIYSTMIFIIALAFLIGLFCRFTQQRSSKTY